MQPKQLTFIPYRPTAKFDFRTPISSVKTIPEWYKKIPQYLDNDSKLKVIPNSPSVNTTIKFCTPFLDALSFGYTIVLADDVQVQLDNEVQRIYWRTNSSLITDHSPDQHIGLPISPLYTEHVWKWSNDWVLKTPPGYSTFFTHPINRYDLPFLNFTGVVDTDLLDIPVQFPFRLAKGFEGILERGTPIIQFFPFKRDSWISEEKEYDHDFAVFSSKNFFGKINRAYKSRFWVKKKFQ
jgi:hypothetical protein